MPADTIHFIWRLRVLIDSPMHMHHLVANNITAVTAYIIFELLGFIFMNAFEERITIAFDFIITRGLCWKSKSLKYASSFILNALHCIRKYLHFLTAI
jgi:hypothetical protein